MGVARAVDYIVSGAGSEESPLRKQDRTHEDPLLDKAPPAGALRFFYGDDGGFAHVEITGGGGRGALGRNSNSMIKWSEGVQVPHIFSATDDVPRRTSCQRH